METSNIGEPHRTVVCDAHLLLHLRSIHYVHLDEVPRANQQAFLLCQARQGKYGKEEERGH